MFIALIVVVMLGLGVQQAFDHNKQTTPLDHAPALRLQYNPSRGENENDAAIIQGKTENRMAEGAQSGTSETIKGTEKSRTAF